MVVEHFITIWTLLLMLLTTVFFKASVAAEDKLTIVALNDCILPEPMTCYMVGQFTGSVGFILAPWTKVVPSSRVFVGQLFLIKLFGNLKVKITYVTISVTLPVFVCF